MQIEFIWDEKKNFNTTGTKERGTVYEKRIRLFKNEGCKKSIRQVSQKTNHDKAEFQYYRVF